MELKEIILKTKQQIEKVLESYPYRNKQFEILDWKKLFLHMYCQDCPISLQSIKCKRFDSFIEGLKPNCNNCSRNNQEKLSKCQRFTNDYNWIASEFRYRLTDLEQTIGLNELIKVLDGAF